MTNNLKTLRATISGEMATKVKEELYQEEMTERELIELSLQSYFAEQREEQRGKLNHRFK